MHRISISFNFWPKQETQNWFYTFLMGEDKEIALKSFSFQVIFNEERAFLINQLWRNFHQFYNNMKSQNINLSYFSN